MYRKSTIFVAFPVAMNPLPKFQYIFIFDLRFRLAANHRKEF